MADKKTCGRGVSRPKSVDAKWLFRILYAGFAGLNEFSELSALSHSSKMFAINICIQDPIEPVKFPAVSGSFGSGRANRSQHVEKGDRRP